MSNLSLNISANQDIKQITTKMTDDTLFQNVQTVGYIYY